MGLDLAGLIDRHRGDRSIEQLSRDCGGVPKAARLHQINRERQKNFPDPDTMLGLSRGLGVPVQAVIHAAARSVGIDVDEGPSRLASLMPVDADRIPERVQDAILAVVRAALAREYEAISREQEGAMREMYKAGQREAERADLDPTFGAGKAHTAATLPASRDLRDRLAEARKRHDEVTVQALEYTLEQRREHSG